MFDYMLDIQGVEDDGTVSIMSICQHYNRDDRRRRRDEETKRSVFCSLFFGCLSASGGARNLLNPLEMHAMDEITSFKNRKNDFMVAKHTLNHLGHSKCDCDSLLNLQRAKLGY